MPMMAHDAEELVSGLEGGLQELMEHLNYLTRANKLLRDRIKAHEQRQSSIWKKLTSRPIETL